VVIKNLESGFKTTLFLFSRAWYNRDEDFLSIILRKETQIKN